MQKGLHQHSYFSLIQPRQRSNHTNGYNNLSFIVKTSFIWMMLQLTLVGVLQATIVKGQTLDDVKIDMNLQGVSMMEGLRSLESKSGIKFCYFEDIILKQHKKVTISGKQLSVKVVLDRLFQNTNLRYKETDACVIVEAKPVAPKPGRITGRVTDAQTGETMIGVGVRVQGKQGGTASDVSGRFSLSCEAGEQTLIFSYIGYKQTSVNVTVKEDASTQINVAMEPAKDDLSEVVVKANPLRNARIQFSTEKTLIDEIKNSPLIITGISNQQISRSLDFNASEVMQRAPGVSMIDNFVNVRGLYERYNMVYINSMIAPSSESDRRAFSFDLLPSGIIDRIIIHRSASADLPADFVGGLVKIHTQEAIKARSIQIKLSTQYREGSSFKDVYSYKGGKTDWLGFDDHTRALPSSIPARGFIPYVSNAGQQDPQTVAENVAVARKLDNNWNLLRDRTGMDFRGQLTYFDSWKVGEGRLNNLSSVFYSNEKQLIRQDFQIGPDGDKDVAYQDTIHRSTARIGAMQNLSYKINERHTIRFNNFFNQLGQNETMTRTGFEYESFSPDETVLQVQYNWRERTLYTSQLSGDHSFYVGKNKHTLQWGSGYAYTLENIPNQRRYEIRDRPAYAPGINNVVIFDEAGAEAFEFNLQNYRATEENGYSYFFDYEFPVVKNLNIKAGFFGEQKSRNFNNRYLTIRPGPMLEQNDETLRLRGIERQYVLSELFGPANFKIDGSGFILRDETAEGSAYNATNDYNAGYMLASANFLHNRLKIYGGLRYELNKLQLNTQLSQGVDAANDVNQLTRYLLPSVNISWQLKQKTEDLLLRLAYGKTLNRPQFRELSAFRNFDLNEGYTEGNPKLVPAEIQNYDLRLEYYPAPGEWISVGLFYKDFKNPIELISVAMDNSLRNSSVLRNSKGATAYGAELEVRRNLAFLPGGIFKDLSVILNAAYMKNEVDLESSDQNYGYDLRDSKRPLQGTSPFLINTGLYYENTKTRTLVTTQYHVFGQRLHAAASATRSDIFELPRHSLDLNVRQTLYRQVELQVGVKNLLDQAHRYYRDFYRDGKYDPSKVAEGYLSPTGGNLKPGSDYYFRKFNEGRYYSLGIIVKL